MDTCLKYFKPLNKQSYKIQFYFQIKIKRIGRVLTSVDISNVQILLITLFL